MFKVATNESSNLAHSDTTFMQDTSKRVFIPPSWLLLDSQSTVSVFNNSALLSNICRSSSPLTVYTNGGNQQSHYIGDNATFRTVWYNPESLANILSMALVRKSHKIMMDSSVEPALLVHCNDRRVFKFREFESGLYFFDTSVIKHKHTSYLPYSQSSYDNSVSFLNTVKSNKSSFTRREIEGADAAHLLLFNMP
jgi:hypothetical protein